MLDYHVGQAVHLSDLKLPRASKASNCHTAREHDLPVATVLAPKGGASV
jgi:hypothetical protein